MRIWKNLQQLFAMVLYFRLRRKSHLSGDVHDEVLKELNRFVDLCLGSKEIRRVVEDQEADREDLIKLYLYLRQRITRDPVEGHKVLFECFYTPEILCYALHMFDGETMSINDLDELESLRLLEEHVKTHLNLKPESVIFPQQSGKAGKRTKKAPR